MKLNSYRPLSEVPDRAICALKLHTKLVFTSDSAQSACISQVSLLVERLELPSLQASS